MTISLCSRIIDYRSLFGGQAMRPAEFVRRRSAKRSRTRSFHAVPLLLIVVVALIACRSRAPTQIGSPAGAAIYVSTTIRLYATSASYHGLSARRTKRLFVNLDYCSIYLLIAGNYTPFTLDVG